MYDYTEFNKLVLGLMEKGITFKVSCHLNGRKVDCGDWDAIINDASYGRTEGLLEAYGKKVVRSSYDDVVEGFLTADEILSRL